jgi:hypothetical protein
MNKAENGGRRKEEKQPFSFLHSPSSFFFLAHNTAPYGLFALPRGIL